MAAPAGKAGRFNCSVAVKPHLPVLTSLMDGSRRGTLAEATDVIGSQSRQEPDGIKHNSYASVQAALDRMTIAWFPHCDDGGTGCGERSAKRRPMTTT
jgi:hypothetical protein